MDKKGKSLEDIARSIRKGLTLPRAPDLEETTQRFLEIIKVYDPNVKRTDISGHSRRRIIEFTLAAGMTYHLDLCESEKERGKISPGVFKKNLEHLTSIIHRDQDNLKLYLTAPKSKVTKKYIKLYPVEGT
ncbi:hypothetical protein HYT58_02770 [Candidatus Woesearchaeota archaeon]|nr:hypothetical protein [Candidatus Woesearchaeota archaeon]